ncbi:uncharacterized protein LOC128232978 [Mya arenaria]|uniref:uncharacterized protein LOC128232978 n=1 Tax=Mya arenaria TaxID=6604 RepID=UPI0022E88675|nr:uncharacterized protein LOC128232978 [Mya arenaria]
MFGPAAGRLNRRLDAALSEYLKKTTPDADIMHKRLQDCPDTTKGLCSHLGQSHAISARRQPFNYFQQFQMILLAFANSLLGMSVRGRGLRSGQAAATVVHAATADDTSSARVQTQVPADRHQASSPPVLQPQ